MSRYYDMDGQPIELMEFCRRYETDEARRIGSDKRGDVHVSTVLLGLNHAWDDGPPLIFETMIFGGEHNEFQERYSTREQAEAGHERALALAFGEAAGMSDGWRVLLDVLLIAVLPITVVVVVIAVIGVPW